MKERLNNILSLLNNKLGPLIAISCSIAFFVLVFKPFPLDHINFDERILFVFGFGVIIFFVILIVRIVYPNLVYNTSENLKRPVLSTYNRGIIIWLLSSALFSIYLIYPGFVSITSFLVFKVSLICLFSPLVLIFHDKIVEVQLENEILTLEKKLYQKKLNEYKEVDNNKSIDFYSANQHEKISLLMSDVVFINSADNYVEIHYKEENKIKKKLIRNTLKNIRLQIKPYHIFVRCHRRYVVNSNYIETLNGNCNHHELFLEGYKKSIPVSRQYFYRIKDAL